jgi:RimJ/RimL family protein N-acetyltransferase
MTGHTIPTRIEVVTIDSFDRSWQLRLRALRDHPDAFGQPYEEAAALADDARLDVFKSFWNHRDNRVFTAVTPDGDLVGMVGLARWYREKMRHRAEIWGMYVSPGYRGTGTAEALMQAAITYGRNSLGLLQVHLEVISTSAAAVRFYERMGFVRYGRMPRADILDGTILDSDLMVLMFDDYPPIRGESQAPDHR